jgi:hypothetical protein
MLLLVLQISNATVNEEIVHCIWLFAHALDSKTIDRL